MTGSSVSSRLSDFFRAEGAGSVVAAYLFGSHAEGRAHRESDVDIGVLLRHEHLPTAGARFEERLLLDARITSLTGDSGKPDLVILNDAPPGLAAAIVTRGQLLYCADPELEHAFRRDSQLQAIDRRPFLARAAEIKRQAIAR